MIYPSLTSTDKNQITINFDQINKLNIDTVCLFLTCLEKEERTDLFERLKKSSITNIPFVHLRSDMDEFEIEYLINNFNTQVFNIHSQNNHPLQYDLSKYKNQIFVENTFGEFDEETIKKFAGICIDFTHLENFRRKDKAIYNKQISQIEKYQCRCGHVGAIKGKPIFDEKLNRLHYDLHYLENMSEVDYLVKYKKYYPEFMVLELENSIEQQLEIIKYLIKI